MMKSKYFTEEEYQKILKGCKEREEEYRKKATKTLSSAKGKEVIAREVAAAPLKKPKPLGVTSSPGNIIGNIMFEQVNQKQYFVYDLAEGKQLQRHEEALWDCWETESCRYVPLRKLPWSKLPFPRSYGSVEDLYKEIRDFVYRHVDFARDVEYDIMAAWALHTWRMENWTITPYLYFYGVPKSGKTRALETLKEVCFRPILGMISTASLFRVTEEWRPTFLLDQAEVYLKGTDKAEIVSYLDAGYRRGLSVVRMEQNPITGKFEPTLYDVFGAKCLGSTEKSSAALMTRAFLFHMSKKTRELEKWFDEEETCTLRGKLFQYRLDALTSNRQTRSVFEDEQNVSMFKEVQDGRIEEIALALYAVAPESVKPLFVKEAIKMESEDVQAEAVGLESIVFHAIAQAHEITHQITPTSVTFALADVVKIVNRDVPIDEQFENKTIGSAVSRLGFKKRRISNITKIVWDEALYQRLLKRYPLS